MRALAVVAALAAYNAASAQGARFKVGEATVYRIDYTNATRSDLRSLFGMDTLSALPSPLTYHIVSEVRGSLEQSVFGRDSVVHVAFQLRDATVSLNVNGQDAASDASAIQEQLGKPMFATLGTNGKILSVTFDPTLDERSRVFARTLLASMQFVVPPRAESTWQSKEQDPAGSFQATYVARGRWYRKTKNRYEPQTPQKTRSGFVAATQTIWPRGSATASFDAGGALVSIESDEQQRVTVADRPIANGATKFRLRRAVTTVISRADILRLRALERNSRALAESLFAPEGDARSDTVIQRTELGTATSATLLARLAELEKSRSDSSSSTQLYLKIKALVYVNPASSDEVGRVLITATPNGPTMLIASQALGAVGHARAQSALARAIRARAKEWPALATLIPVLGGVSEPTDETVRLILELAFESATDEVRSTALLAAGTLARSLGATPRSVVIVRRLVDALETSRTAGMKRDLLFAVGNSGSALALAAVERLTRDRDQSIRAAAFFALRLMDSSRVDSLLRKASVSDSDSTVRATATRVLELRKRLSHG